MQEIAEGDRERGDAQVELFQIEPTRTIGLNHGMVCLAGAIYSEVAGRNGASV